MRATCATSSSRVTCMIQLAERPGEAGARRRERLEPHRCEQLGRADVPRVRHHEDPVGVQLAEPHVPLIVHTSSLRGVTGRAAPAAPSGIFATHMDSGRVRINRRGRLGCRIADRPAELVINALSGETLWQAAQASFASAGRASARPAKIDKPQLGVNVASTPDSSSTRWYFRPASRLTVRKTEVPFGIDCIAPRASTAAGCWAPAPWTRFSRTSGPGRIAFCALRDPPTDRCLCTPIRADVTSQPHRTRQCGNLEILRLVAQGLSNGEIAASLVLSEHTVKTHVAHLLQKLNLRDRTQAVVAAYESRARPAGRIAEPGGTSPEESRGAGATSATDPRVTTWSPLHLNSSES